jgi:hypothetical protein
MIPVLHWGTRFHRCYHSPSNGRNTSAIQRIAGSSEGTKQNAVIKIRLFHFGRFYVNDLDLDTIADKYCG